MKRVIFVHRWAGGPEDDWLPWLKTELEKHGYTVLVPEMPDTEIPVIAKWVGRLSHVVGVADDQTFFIGHSIGCQTILRYLETIDTPVGGAIFVAGWFRLEHLEDEAVEAIARPWMEKPIHPENINRVLQKSTLIVSDNDPYGAFEINVQKFKELHSNIITLHNAGHITSEDGFSEAPIIREQFLALEHE